MPTYVIQAVERSMDGGKSVRVVNRWPHEASCPDDARAFVDATPAFSGWDNANTFEVLDASSKLIAARLIAGPDSWKFEA